MRHEHEQPSPFLLSATQAAHHYADSPYTNYYDFLDSPQLASDSQLADGIFDLDLDFQENAAFSEATLSKPVGLGIVFEGYDPFTRPTSKITPSNSGSDVGSFSPIFGSGLRKLSDSPSAADFPDSDRASSNAGPRTPEVAPSPSFSFSGSISASWLLDPADIFADMMVVDSPLPSAQLPQYQETNLDFTPVYDSPLIGLFPDLNMYQSMDVDACVGIDPRCLMLDETRSTHREDRAEMSFLADLQPVIQPKEEEQPFTDLLTYLSIDNNPPALQSGGGAVAETLDVPLKCDEQPVSVPLVLVPVPICSEPSSQVEAPLQSQLPNSPIGGFFLEEKPPSGLGGASPDTPVFDTHLGVGVDDLIRRADRYRRRFPGQEIERHWFLLYAGKLTEDGQAMDDYRCYVTGCSKTNKRRDHILVHVGSHVSERPFACSHCGMRFLRRNECKRHEANHLGTKPYVCDLCAESTVRFARQDLLTRHMRRTHDIDRTADRRKRRRTASIDAVQVPVQFDGPGNAGPIAVSFAFMSSA
ncbi:hypothetical protein EWM64_g2199 [Hericium alpestre]|uniref:C2H2-type domain-containing protein n=1 Tax=Hericium alpestre TaxID=135208 RepID=A0A4Z0A847_9AGAM|nr:hypothetical protein EWM64_g2199 [Hericium alpestre]